ncbi:translocation/assembly module TamB domain-containing protein [Roseomonas sp. E05]|uniref:translocation/assembly module TamB domain-containing protein n=1 Tax=Roseomonas sp. E05 TaxID=3046310 RepID=UPI0024BACB27|nr:translocation/assembly module TamB domain-containing protein [Roseomonas sp. E05]MDJ0388160.1 translocation/assembly module TamB domain-containing protein [Roseomonas sp. E05]
MRRVFRWSLVAAVILGLGLPVLTAGAAPEGTNIQGTNTQDTNTQAAEAAPEPGLISGAAGRMVVSLLQRFVPGLQIEGLRPVPGAISFSRLTMADAKGPWLELDDVRLNFGLFALLKRDLRISELTAARMALLRLPEAGAEQPAPPPPDQQNQSLLPSLPDLPVDLFVEKLSVARIEIPRELVAATVEEHGRTPGFALSLNGSASLTDAALTADLAVQRLEAEGRLDLKLRMDPKQQLLVDLQVQEPPQGVLATALRIPDAPAQLSLHLEGPPSGADLRASADFGGQAGFQANGRLAMAPDGSGSLALQGHLDAPASLAPPPVATVDFDLDGGITADKQPVLNRLRLTAPAGEVTAQGNLDLLRAEAHIASSAALGTLVPQIIGWESIDLDARVTNGEQIQATLRPHGLTGPDPLASVLGPEPVADYAGTAFRIDSLTVRGRGATLEASGTGWDQLDLTAKLTVPELQAVRPELSGPATLEAHVTGPATDPAIAAHLQSPGLVAAGRRIEALDLTAEMPSVSGMAGTLRLTAQAEGQPVSVALHAARDGDLVRLTEAEADFGPAHATADGVFNTATTRFDGGLNVAAENLAPLAGLIGQPVSGGLRVEAKLETAPDGRQLVDAHAATRNFQLAGQPYAVDATLQGSNAALDWNVKADLPQANLQGHGQFAQTDQGMRLDIAAFNASQGEMGVRLTQPATIRRLPNGAIEIPGLRLAAQPAGDFTISGRWGPDTADIRVALAALPASVVNQFAPQPPLSGTVVGEARITGPVSAPEVNATLNGTNLRTGADWAAGWPAATLRVEAHRAGSGAVRANAALRMGSVVTLNAEANLPQGPGADAPLSARVTGQANLQPLAAPTLGGSANQVAGRISIDGGASGTLGAPSLNGTATLANGEVRNPLYGLRLTNITGRVRAAGDQILLENFVARAGSGRITMRGNAQPFQPGIPMEVDITARDATPLQSELVTALMDADLRFTGPLQTSPALGGTVRLQRVAITIPQSLPGGGVPTLGEVRERGAAAPKPPAPGPAAPPIALNIKVEAPQSILVRGRGLDAELGGSLTIGGTAANPQPDGAFTLRRGNFQLLDRRLNFSEGSLTFDGTMTPRLDFTATTTAQGVSITVSITGPANDPKITFSSSPEMPQDEILARLLFNRPLNKLSPFEIAQLAGGAASLAGVGPGGSRGFFGKIADKLGLDRLGVGSTSDTGSSSGDNSSSVGNPSLEAGGYVGKGVYVGVEQGTKGGPRVGVEVELTPRLKLESSTGGEVGERVGLSYEFEY